MLLGRPRSRRQASSDKTHVKRMRTARSASHSRHRRRVAPRSRSRRRRRGSRPRGLHTPSSDGVVQTTAHPRHHGDCPRLTVPCDGERRNFPEKRLQHGETAAVGRGRADGMHDSRTLRTTERERAGLAHFGLLGVDISVQGYRVISIAQGRGVGRCDTGAAASPRDHARSGRMKSHRELYDL